MNPGPPPERLDHCLLRLGLATSRRLAKALIESDRVRVNGRRMRKGETVAAGEQVEIIEPLPPATIVPEPARTIAILYEDAALVVVNKPGLMPCHPLRGGELGTVMNAVAARYPDAAINRDKPLEGGLVHRLDNGTSGALIIARTAAAFTTLRSAIRTGQVWRQYVALIATRMPNRMLTGRELSTPIAHHPKNPRKMVTSDDHGLRGARPASTTIIPETNYGDFTLVRVLPRTGSRHQIRVHLASIGHPLAGDMLYGGPALDGLAPGRFWLHLAALELDSPARGRVRIEAPLADDLTAALPLTYSRMAVNLHLAAREEPFAIDFAQTVLVTANRR